MKKTYRTESDSIGELQVERDAYYGVQTLRAKRNFSITDSKMNFTFVKNIVLIKKAAALVNGVYGILDQARAEAIVSACDEVLAGKHRKEFVVDAVQGGAGTSANMNVNEVIANLAAVKLGGKPGDYAARHPNDHVNMEQSTNDVIPTAGKLTVIVLSRALLSELRRLERALKKKAEDFTHPENGADAAAGRRSHADGAGVPRVCDGDRAGHRPHRAEPVRNARRQHGRDGDRNGDHRAQGIL